MANLVRYPGGSKNKGNYNITGPYYIRIWLPNLKKVKLIPTNTENHKEAERKLKIVSEKEWLIKTEQSLLLAGLSEHRNDGKLITVVNEALGLDIITTLHKACIDYLESCNKRISQNTIDSYDIALNDLQNALSPSIRVSELSKRHFEILIDYFKKNYKSKVTINIRLRGIRAFLHWLVDAEYVEKMPFKVRLLKIEDELPKFLTPADIQAIYSQIDDPVMLSTVKVYEATGIRLSELFYSTLNGKFLTVIGKGKKERIVPIPDTVIKDYLIATAEYESAKDKLKKEFTNPRIIEMKIELYVDTRKKRITSAFTKAYKLAGITGKRSLHSLRHTYALRMLVEFGEIHLVQKLLGHSSVTVTEVYTKFPIEYLKSIFTSKIYQSGINPIA